MFYGHVCALSEVEDEIALRYAHAEIRTHVIVICDFNVLPIWPY